MNDLQRELVKAVQIFATTRETTLWQRIYVGRVLRALRQGQTSWQASR